MKLGNQEPSAKDCPDGVIEGRAVLPAVALLAEAGFAEDVVVCDVAVLLVVMVGPALAVLALAPADVDDAPEEAGVVPPLTSVALRSRVA
jgi:hypothetical protein